MYFHRIPVLVYRLFSSSFIIALHFRELVKDFFKYNYINIELKIPPGMDYFIIHCSKKSCNSHTTWYPTDALVSHVYFSSFFNHFSSKRDNTSEFCYFIFHHLIFKFNSVIYSSRFTLAWKTSQE